MNFLYLYLHTSKTKKLKKFKHIHVNVLFTLFLLHAISSRYRRQRYACVLVTLFLLRAISMYGQLQEESMRVVYRQTDPPMQLQPGQSFEQAVTFDRKDYEVRRFLRVVGGVVLPGTFASRGSGTFWPAEFLIDDCLDSVTTFRDPHSLYFKGEGEPFERHAYNRITENMPRYDEFAQHHDRNAYNRTTRVLSTGGTLSMETAVKRDRLKIHPGGDFGVELQVYYRKEGRYKDDIYDTADTLLYMPVPEGSGDFTMLKASFTLPDNVACILLRTGGTTFSGECWMEAPRLYLNNRVIFEMPFVKHIQRISDYNYWTGINFSIRNWPRWRLEWEGQTIFEGSIFDRSSPIADFYIPLPPELNGSGKIRLTLLKENHRANFPYKIQEVQLLEESARNFEIVSVPLYVSCGDTAGLLLEINKPDITLQFMSDASLQFEQETVTFHQTGLHAVSFMALEPAVEASITVTGGSDIRKASVGQVIVKDRDNIFVSSGDCQYIDKEFIPYDMYFKWYFRSRIGNWFQFRPSYQWSGVRITEESFVKHYTHLLACMHVPYAWQVEGRTLASSRINPSVESLHSPMFRGKQAHENDGNYYYWQHHIYNGLYADMGARLRPFGGIRAKHRPLYTDHGIFVRYDPYIVKDMADGANRFVANLSYSRGESTRHTGPSTLFRYFYQAGYDWLGAEQMYGPEDVIMSSLRGASRAYGKNDYGSLHAMQWGSFPFTDPKHALRHYLSLAVAYMHGSSHINTEEGLWTDDNDNDRFTAAGKRHVEAQHLIFDYVQTHARKGYLNTPIAIVQGRNDAWKAGSRISLWAQNGDKWQFNLATESFDLIKAFYPENRLNALNGVPEGWFTSTPYGAIDLLPIEAPSELMCRYKTLIFLGWNSFDNYDFIRIRKFVEQGGNLLLTAAHLNSELQPDAPVRFPVDDTVVKMLLGEDYRTYSQKAEIRLGKGKIIYFPQPCYPADPLIREAYTESINAIATSVIQDEPQKGWIKAAPFINFSAWDTPTMRTLYVLNVDWQNEQSLPCTLLLGDSEFRFDADIYALHTIRCADGLGVMPAGNTTDILDIRKEAGKYIITCQTTGKDTILLFDAHSSRQESRELPAAGIHRVEY